MTSPDAGFGVNSVDLRGIRAPAAATAATAATGVARSSTAVASRARARTDRLVDRMCVADRVHCVFETPDLFDEAAVQHRDIEIGQRRGLALVHAGGADATARIGHDHRARRRRSAQQRSPPRGRARSISASASSGDAASVISTSQPSSFSSAWASGIETTR